VVPSSEILVAAMKEGYRNGKFRYHEVLEAQRTLIADRKALLEGRAILNREGAVLRMWTEGFGEAEQPGPPQEILKTEREIKRGKEGRP